MLIAETTKHLLNRFGIRVLRDRPVRDAHALFIEKFRSGGATTVLDIGANVGQFATELRRRGMTAPIVSFEPQSAAHADLTRAARGKQGWTVAPRMALGSTDGVATMNIAHNSVSSSLLDVAERSVALEPGSGFGGSEDVPVRRLDDVVGALGRGPYGIKVDTQGFELEVLAGGRNTFAETVVVDIEMSLVPLYHGGARFVDTYAAMEDAGFACIALIEGFRDDVAHEVLQVDGIFIRR